MPQNHGFTVVAGLFILPITMQACADNQKTCEKIGRCAHETGGAGSGGEQETPECATESPCDDNNPCTEDQCDAGTCVHASVIDGTADGPCRTCVGGAPEVTETLCGEGKVCNGVGECVSCEGDMCPTGYTCTGGACLGNLGTPCSLGGECAGGLPCVDNVCCSDSCDLECVSCNGENPGTCEPSPQYALDTLCVDNDICDGQGHCKRENGETCIYGGNCASGVCNQQGLCEPQ